MLRTEQSTHLDDLNRVTDGTRPEDLEQTAAAGQDVWVNLPTGGVLITSPQLADEAFLRADSSAKDILSFFDAHRPRHAPSGKAHHTLLDDDFAKDNQVDRGRGTHLPTALIATTLEFFDQQR